MSGLLNSSPPMPPQLWLIPIAVLVPCPLRLHCLRLLAPVPTSLSCESAPRGPCSKNITSCIVWPPPIRSRVHSPTSVLRFSLTPFYIGLCLFTSPFANPTSISSTTPTLPQFKAVTPLTLESLPSPLFSPTKEKSPSSLPVLSLPNKMHAKES